MCAIHCILSPHASGLKEQIQRMSGISQHRGPDNEDHLILPFGDWHLAMAANRLQITGQQAFANQPMKSEDGRYALVFNGEIYNHQDLKNELVSLGYTYRSASDTETLFYGLQHFGSKFLSKLNGMFALIFADTLQKTLIVSRDSSGIKPLWYAENNELLVISSECKPIQKIVGSEINFDSFRQILTFGYTPKGKSNFEGIEAYSPGKYFEYNLNNDTKSRIETPYLDASVAYRETAKSPESLQEVLVDSLYRQSVADHPVGLLLSGGVDSTLLLALIQKKGLHPIPSFSIAYPQKDKPFASKDQDFAAKAALKYGSIHYEIGIEDNSILELPDFVKSLDQAIGDSAAYLTWKISGEAKKKVKVLLSGAGADEWFAGYPRHQLLQMHLKESFPMKFLKKLSQSNLIQRLASHASILPGGYNVQRLLLSMDSDPGMFFLKSSMLYPGFSGIDLPEITHNWSEDTMERALAWDKQEYLGSGVLRLSDLMSMQHGIELRVPYLDEEVKAFAGQFSIEENLQIRQKDLLKSLLENIGGRAFTKRKKQGFGMPLDAWTRRQHKYLDGIILNPENSLYNCIDFKEVLRIWSAHKKGKIAAGRFIWALSLCILWIENQSAE